ncbi:hypothetical protein WCWAEYFT_CDS0226 [Vibrio phage VB_VaC_TDDLMA]
MKDERLEKFEKLNISTWKFFKHLPKEYREHLPHRLFIKFRFYFDCEEEQVHIMCRSRWWTKIIMIFAFIYCLIVDYEKRYSSWSTIRSIITDETFNTNKIVMNTEYSTVERDIFLTIMRISGKDEYLI